MPRAQGLPSMFFLAVLLIIVLAAGSVTGVWSSLSYEMAHKPVANVTDASAGIENATVTEKDDLRVRFTGTAAQLGISDVYLYSDSESGSRLLVQQSLTPRDRVVQFDHEVSFNTTYTVLAVDGSNRIKERTTVRIDPVPIEEDERDA